MNEEVKEQKVVDVLPLTKWKRILIFLADFFFNFIFAFLLMNIAVMPLGKVFTSYDKKDALYQESVFDSHSVLYGHKVVLISPSYDEDDIDFNIEYTFDCWLSYYAMDEIESMDPNFPQYGHKIDNEVIYHFYNDIRSDINSYVSLFNLYDKETQYFTESGGQMTLKDTVKNEIYAYFDPGNEMGDVGNKYYDTIKGDIFLPLLSEVFINIETNDLVYNNISYIEAIQTIHSISIYHDNLVVVCAYISFFLGWLIYHIIIPLVNKNHKTISMMMMHIERINVARLYITKKPEAVLIGLYNFFTNLAGIFFVPFVYVSFNYLFSLTWLLFPALTSLLFCLISLFFVLFNSFNRSLSDILCRSVLITTDKLDEIYRARGYNI